MTQASPKGTHKSSSSKIEQISPHSIETGSPTSKKSSRKKVKIEVTPTSPTSQTALTSKKKGKAPTRKESSSEVLDWAENIDPMTPVLTDCLKVGMTPWSQSKHYAMRDHYESQQWYLRLKD